MKLLTIFSLGLGLGLLTLVGCQQSPPGKQTNNMQNTQTDTDNRTNTEHGKAGPVSAAEIKKALDKLSAEDRSLAEAQKKCPVSGEPLGSMGTPVKHIIKGEPVFLCCSSCNTKALAHADRTLAKVKQFKEEKKGDSEK